MLKILFSPSEGKNPGGDLPTKELLGSNSARSDILNEYNNIVARADEDEITKLEKQYAAAVDARNVQMQIALKNKIHNLRQKAKAAA